MDMIKIEKDMVEYADTLDQDTPWEDLAAIISAATYIQGTALDVAINKGLSEEMTAQRIVDTLVKAGCKLGHARLFRLIDFHAFKIELSNCPPTENLTEPETVHQFIAAKEGSAIETTEKFTEITESLGEKPTGDELRAIRAAEKDFAERAQFKRSQDKDTVPKYLSAEEMVSFDEWFLENVGQPRQSFKPDIDYKEVIHAKDIIINDLAAKYDDWKINRRKFLAHNNPDAGGTDEFFVFAKTLDDLMHVVGQLIKLAEFKQLLRLHKNDWWDSVGSKL